MAGNKIVTVTESDGVTETDVEVLGMGRQAEAASKSVTLSTEDKTVLDALSTKLTTLDGRVDGLEALIGTTNTTLSTISSSLTTIDGRVDGLEGQTGIVTETAPTTDTASSGLNGRLQRISQRLTSLLPASMTVKAASTAAVATDPAFVVAISPNGQNLNGRAAATDSTPTVMSTEDLAEVTAIKTSVQLLDDAVVADDAAFTPGTTKVHMAGFHADETSTDSIDEGDGGAARMTLDRKQIMTPQPHTKGGLLAFCSLDLDETEEDVKTSAGQVYGYHVANRTTSPLFLRFYNATAANVTVGTTATFLGPFEIPANANDHTVMLANFGGQGIEFDTAISAAVTTGFAAADTSGPAANGAIVSVFYK